MRRFCLSAILVFALALASVAADAPLTYIKAGRLFEAHTGSMRTGQVIVVRGDKIEYVGVDASAPPAGSRVIDLSGATVLPGLIDAHTHLTGDPRYHGYQSLGISMPRAALHGVYAARVTLEAGFTTVRNAGADGYSDVALRDAIQDREFPGPRMVVSGPALGITGGHCDDNLLPAEYHHTSGGVADGPWPARAKVREVAKYGADFVKICASGGVLSKGDDVGVQQYTLEEMQAIVEEAHKLGRKVAAHAHGTEAINAALRAGVDSVEHSSLIDDEGVRLAKEHHTALVFDIYNDDFILQKGKEVGMLAESLEKERKIGQLQRENFRRAYKGGARIVFGTDAGVYPHGDNAKQFFYMVKFGMQPAEAIQAATIHAADLLGWSAQVGALDEGKYADIIAVEGDPLSDVTRLEHVGFVMKGGEVVKNTFGK